MNALRVLLAVEQGFHREAVALSLSSLAPLVEVVSAEPEDLEQEASRFEPHLIICSHTTAAARRGKLAWVQLSSSGCWLASVRIDEGLDERSFFSGNGLSELTSMIDFLTDSLVQEPLTRH